MQRQSDTLLLADVFENFRNMSIKVYELDPAKINKINEEFIKSYDENDNKGYIFEVDVKYPKRLHELHSDLPFLSERMEVNKCKKLVCNLFNKKKYVVHINSLKQALNHGLKLKKIHRALEFN